MSAKDQTVIKKTTRTPLEEKQIRRTPQAGKQIPPTPQAEKQIPPTPQVEKRILRTPQGKTTAQIPQKTGQNVLDLTFPNASEINVYLNATRVTTKLTQREEKLTGTKLTRLGKGETPPEKEALEVRGKLQSKVKTAEVVFQEES